ncbi:MAG: thiamine-phosphate kinase [Gemmatimonadaceae bacterium]|nr:thiamine-phosphate kinase [Gemmatimonadaceae bacterium]
MFTSHTVPSPDDAFRAHQAMGSGREFDTIRLLMSRWGDLTADIGDDAALLPPRASGTRVVSTDACVEHVHFRSAWLSPREIGHRAAAAALSDLAAMGASAEFMLVAFVVPESWDAVLPDVADGIGDVVREVGARIVGGNLSRGATFGITLTVIGNAERPVSRRGAQPGDLVLVTGTLGGPGSALAAWLDGQEPSAWARERFVHPWPRIAQGQLLASHGVTAMLDISDGLAADARHLSAASGVWLALDAQSLPTGPDCAASDVLASGEEYELLATLPPELLPALQQTWNSTTHGRITVIGRVEAVTAAHSKLEPLVTPVPIAGHDHFAEAAERVENPPRIGEL